MHLIYYKTITLILQSYLYIITYLCIILLLFYCDRAERMDAHNVLNDILQGESIPFGKRIFAGIGESISGT